MDFWTRGNRRTLDASRHTDRPGRISAHYPNETACTARGCGWDETTQSAKKFNCPVCQGRGTIVNWQTAYLRARANWTGLMQFSFLTPAPGVELGDVVLTIGKYDLDMVRRVLNSERAYFTVDGTTVRPSLEQKLDVPTIGEEFQVVCHKYTPTAE